MDAMPGSVYYICGPGAFLADDIFGDQANTAYVVTTKTKKG
jgi:hypothetical protein